MIAPLVPNGIDAISLAHYERLIHAAKVKPRDPLTEALIDNFETVVKALKAHIRPDRSQLLLVAGAVAGTVALSYEDDGYVARRSVAIARGIVDVIDEVGQ